MLCTLIKKDGSVLEQTFISSKPLGVDIEVFRNKFAFYYGNSEVFNEKLPAEVLLNNSQTPPLDQAQILPLDVVSTYLINAYTAICKSA